jgi:viroplasmin and RNaseH domain-containing protein
MVSVPHLLWFFCWAGLKLMTECRARTHVVVTGISYKEVPHKGFKTLDEAREWMEKQGVKNPEEVLRPKQDYGGARAGFCYYAVANGRNPGVTEIYT